MDRDALHRLLRRIRPAAVVHVDDAGASTNIALAPGRGRWEHAADALADLARTSGGSVELRDANGAVIRRVRVDVDDAPPASDGVQAPAPAPASDASIERLLALMMKAQDSALDRQRALLEPLVSGYTDLARAHSEYAAQVVELVRLSAAAHAAQAEAAAAAAPGSPQLEQLVALAAQRLATQ